MIVQVVVERIAGLDVHKDSVVACVRVPGERQGRRRQDVRTFKTFASGLAELPAWLAEERVGQAVMEATGVFWKPVWYALEDAVGELVLVNARQVKKVPGRKTDLLTELPELMAQLGECGLVSASFVPPEPIRDLRDLTRYRKRVVQSRAQEVLRVQKLLEDAGFSELRGRGECSGAVGLMAMADGRLLGGRLR
jgi:transposase